MREIGAFQTYYAFTSDNTQAAIGTSFDDRHTLSIEAKKKTRLTEKFINRILNCF